MKLSIRILGFLFLLFVVVLPLYAYEAAVVSAHPLASQAGLTILKKGGNAADAAIATAFALGVVEPHNSGLGGGGFLLYYDAQKKKFFFIDYREQAPLKARYQFYQNNPKKLAHGIHAVGVPGFVKGMEVIHQQWHQLEWAALLAPAIKLAEKGFPLKGKLVKKIIKNKEKLSQDPESFSTFVVPLENKHPRIIQLALAKSLKIIQKQGAQSFYDGFLANQLIHLMKQKRGLITYQDLQRYQVYFRKPHHFKKGSYELVSAPRPSSGGEGLELLFRKDQELQIWKHPPYSPQAFQFFLKALKDYFIYRENTLGDTSANIISHTTHLNVIDQEGNIASMTNTLNHNFGTGIMVPKTGILLNNEMDDFSLNKSTPNQILPLARPLSSMSPTIIFKKDQPYLVLGTPGGITIPQNLFQILYFHWQWNSSLRSSLKHAKIYYSPRSNQVVVEKRISQKIRLALQNHQEVSVAPDPIGNVQLLHIINKRQTIFYSDPRGEGKGYTN